jgi:hypothetical protein
MYIVSEVQNAQSTRKGEKFDGSLRAAKAKATRDQLFQGTVLKIETEDGRLVAVKDKGKWADYGYSGHD